MAVKKGVTNKKRKDVIRVDRGQAHIQCSFNNTIVTITDTRGNAISASTRDPRFRPIRKEELPFLEISVDVLGEAEDIESEAELDVKRYGVIVSKGMRRGLLLPDLEGVDTVGQQVAIAKQKAGIGQSEKVSLQRFEVVRHS